MRLLTCVPGTLDGSKGIQGSINKALPSRAFLGVKGERTLGGQRWKEHSREEGKAEKKRNPCTFESWRANSYCRAGSIGGCKEKKWSNPGDP